MYVCMHINANNVPFICKKYYVQVLLKELGLLSASSNTCQKVNVIYLHLCMCACACMYICLSICMWVGRYVCMHVCIYVCLYVGR